MTANTSNSEVVSDKSRLAATLLVWFLGSLGVHRFYIGKAGTGFAILILGVVGWITTWTWGLGFIFLVVAGIWVFIDFIMIIFGAMKDSKGNVVKKW